MEDSDNNGGMCHVTCPDCNVEVVQCSYCEFNFAKEDNKVLRQRGTNPESYMKRHHKRKHKITTASTSGKKRKQNENDEAMECDEAGGFEIGPAGIDNEHEVYFSSDDGGCHHSFASSDADVLNVDDDAQSFADFGDSHDHVQGDGHESVGSFSLDSDDMLDDLCPSCHSDSPSSSSTSSSSDVTLDDRHLFDEEVINSHVANATMADDEEEEQACAFVYDLMDDLCKNLDPNAVDEEHEELLSPFDRTEASPTARAGSLSYEDFQFFDTRACHEKMMRNGLERKSQNQLYFFQMYQHQLQHEGDKNGGFAGLVHRANKRNREDDSKIARPKETKQILRLLRILLRLSGKNREDVIEYQNGLMELFDVGRHANDVETRFPVDMKDTRTMLLDGAHSIMKNFPVQKVFEINNHACVGLKETIRLAAGHGAKFNFAWDATENERERGRNHEGLNGTQAVKDLLRDVNEAMEVDEQVDDEDMKDTSIGWIYFWSDSFLRCYVKQRENSVWILTATVCPPESEKSTGKYTFVLAMGKSSEDHEEVINHFLEEAKDLMKGFKCYFGNTNDIRRMAVGLLSLHGDRPEKQSNGQTRQEGHWGKVSGHAVRIDEKRHPACNACYRKLVVEMSEGELVSGEGRCTCREPCFNWTLEPNVEEQKTIPVDSDYPTVGVEGLDAPEGRVPGVPLLGPVKLSAEFLRTASTLAYTARLNNVWKKATVKSYLQKCNITDSRIDKIINKAEEDRKHNRTSEPEQYQPKIWTVIDCFDRFRLPDLPMHALAHGIIADCMDIIHQIFAHHKKATAFFNFANVILEQVTSCRLDYCKVKSLPKAAWVGENTMGYMRLFSYLYGAFLSNFPLCPNEDESRRTVSNLRCLLNALQALMSVLMSKEECDHRTINNHMKLLMSSAHLLHKTYGSLSNKVEAEPQSRKRKKKQKKKESVDLLSGKDAENILTEFGIAVPQGGVGIKRARVAKIGREALKQKLRALTGKKRSFGITLKSQLQRKAFEHILGRELTDEKETSASSTTENEREGKPETMCWNKGNWLSFLANIANQIAYMGNLGLIW